VAGRLAPLAPLLGLLQRLQPLPAAPVRLWGEQIRSCATAAVKRRPQLVGCLGVGQLLRVDGAAAADEFQPHPRSPGARLEHRHEVTQRHAERSQHKVRDGAPRDRAVIVCGVAQRVQHTDGEVDGIDVLTVAHGIFCELDIDVQLPELAPVLTVRIPIAQQVEDRVDRPGLHHRSQRTVGERASKVVR